jgi:hypothetical protein
VVVKIAALRVREEVEEEGAPAEAGAVEQAGEAEASGE